MHDLAAHAGQTEIKALVTETEALVLDAEQVEDGGVEIVHMDRFFGRSVAFALDGTAMDQNWSGGAGPGSTQNRQAHLGGGTAQAVEDVEDGHAGAQRSLVRLRAGWPEG